MKKYFSILLLLIMKIGFAQGPWIREKNSAYIQLGGTSLQYDKQQKKNMLIDLESNVSDITAQLYVEYGLVKKLEVLIVVPYKIISENVKFVNIKNNISGLGNVTLGLKYNIFDKNWKISSGLHYIANSIQKSNTSGLTTGFNAATIFPFVTLGSSSDKWYYFGNFGYGYMNNNYSDFIRIGAEVGYRVVEKGHIMLVLDNRIIVAKEEAFNTDPNQWTSYSDQQSYMAAGLKLNYEFKKNKFGANFAVISAIALNNAPVAPTFNFGIYTII